MTLIGSGIHINMGQMAAGALGNGAAVEFVDHNAFGPKVASVQADTNAEWTLLTDTVQGIQQTNARWYAARITGYTGVRWSTLPVPLVSNDNYMDVEANGAWSGVGEYFGPALRMSATAKSFYAFVVSGDSKYTIRRAFEGALIDTTGTLAAPIANGDIIRIEVEGDVVRGYVNGGLVDTYTDVSGDKNTTGWPGIVAAGLDTDHGLVNFKCGDLATPGNLSVYGDYAWRAADDREYVDSCFSGDDPVDGIINTADLHIAVAHPHWIEIDFIDFRVPSRIRNHGQTAAYYDWDDVDVLTKVAAEDDWTEVATGLDLDNDGVDGWKESGLFSIIQPCRYVRVEINSSLYSNDNVGSEEVQFYCQGQS